ncbi:alpha-amylase family protein [Oceaniglobus trochenteri]|uniref:alpha-amylase family protein n=1 Tax=Oceaniglobus trochenteri TaxID=2763260 RepID=UPI001CFF7C45|nr:alpha-L-fucosidase [Oceaniglobus trochenteri]
MRFRQIHLDFHTAGQIDGVGSRFDPDAFGDAFRDARVNAVNLFSKCHHGYSYHPTEIGMQHPSLDFDLLGEQIKALQARDILAPVYVSALWDELAAYRHPEWRVVSADNSRPVQHGNDMEAGWKFLDLSSPYQDYLCSQIEEVVQRYSPLDGIWMDINFQLPSISPFAKDGMEAEGLDWTDAEHRDLYAERVTFRYLERVKGIADRADCPVFFNFGHLRRGRPEILRKYFSHIEIESLPTGSWGYEHFPVSARYMEGLGMEMLGMTGKFHHMWGEVGGYKKPEAMIYECGAMLAQGAKVCIGDHLHPTGRVDPSTYAGVGQAYEWIEAREPWCEGSRNRAEIGVLSDQALRKPAWSGFPGHHETIDDGCVRLLLENRFTFDLLGEDGDFDAYRLLILPDAIHIDAALKKRLDAYLAQGGKLLLTGQSGIDGDTMHYPAGTRHHGTAPFTGGDFALPVEDLRASFVDEPLFMYAPSQQLTLDGGTSLGEVYDPYLDRSGPNFSGHLNAPNRPDPNGYVLGAQDGAVLRLAHPVFSIYYRVGAVAMVEMVGRVIDRALGQERMIRTDMPTAGRATLRRQDGRDVLHLCHANPVQRGVLRRDRIQPIQDVVPLHDVKVDIESEAPASVRLVPEGSDLPFKAEGGRVRFTVPKVWAHQMVEIAHR